MLHPISRGPALLSACKMDLLAYCESTFTIGESSKMLTPARDLNDGSQAAAGTITSLALLAAVGATTLLVLVFVLVTLIVPFVFPLAVIAIAALTRIEEVRLARAYVRTR